MKIQEIKARLSIVQVLSYYGLEMNKNKHINCPFHDDKVPSMRVYEETNTVYCFSGNCEHSGKSMDVIELVQQKELCSKYKAIMICKGLLNEVEGGILGVESTSKKEVRAIDQIWKSLQGSLNKKEAAKAYLKSRGLSLQYAGYHSGHFYKSKLAEQAKEVGLITVEGKAWARNCILFPLKNGTDQLVSFYGRSLMSGHYYQSGRTGLFPNYPSKKARRIILTESVIDAASLLEIGALKEYEILALYGTNGMTGEHKKALQSCGELEEVILMLDGDEAGTKASKKYSKELTKLLPSAKIRSIELPANTDINELWANHLNEDLFTELLKKTESVNKEESAAPAGSAPATPLLDTSQAGNLKYAGLHGKYYVKGFKRDRGLDSLKVTLVIEVGAYKSRGRVELYEDAAVAKYCRAASEKVGVSAELLELDINLLTEALEEYREAKQEQEEVRPKSLHLSAAQKAKAKDFLKQKELFKRLNDLIGATGIVGEEKTRLLLLLVASSYKCKSPLHALIQGSTGTGKTLLLRKIMGLIPAPRRHIWTRITDKSLYHSGRQYEHASTAIEDWDGLSEEVQYVFRELQSGHMLSSSTTEKQSDGELRSKEILAHGPISSLICTTKGSIYEDNMSRCFMVAIDEGEEQSQRIINYQNAKMRGEIATQLEQDNQEFIQSMIEILEPIEVVNPYAGQVSLPEGVHKVRRLNYLYLVFVQQVAWWHQYQRERDKEGRIIVSKEDLKLACELLFETIVLKVDELDGSLRQFYERLKEYVQESKKSTFTRRELRQGLRVSRTSLHRYLNDLESMEYLSKVRGQSQSYSYQLGYLDDYQALRSRLQGHLQEQIAQLSDLKETD
ncbi:MAG: toprim domain-containing protein [Aureispira sp.]